MLEKVYKQPNVDIPKLTTIQRDILHAANCGIFAALYSNKDIDTMISMGLIRLVPVKIGTFATVFCLSLTEQGKRIL